MSHPGPPFMNGSTPTALLLHGAFTDASSWAGVIAELGRDGIGVEAPALSLRGLASDAVYIASVAARFDGPLLLAGHGYGGAVATVAGAAAGNVVGLVYVAGFALDLGESVVEVLSAFPQAPFGSGLRPAEFRDGTAGAAVELYLKAEAFRDVFAADVPEGGAGVMAAAQRPVAAAALEEKAPAAGWRALPSWYVVATADRALHPDAQRFMASRAGAETVEVDASHAVALSRPAVVAERIRAAAESFVRSRPVARAGSGEAAPT